MDNSNSKIIDSPLLLWLACETTDNDSSKGWLLEVAWRITDRNGLDIPIDQHPYQYQSGDWLVPDRECRLVQYHSIDKIGDLVTIDPAIEERHKNSGLELALVEASRHWGESPPYYDHIHKDMLNIFRFISDLVPRLYSVWAKWYDKFGKVKLSAAGPDADRTRAFIEAQWKKDLKNDPWAHPTAFFIGTSDPDTIVNLEGSPHRAKLAVDYAIEKFKKLKRS